MSADRSHPRAVKSIAGIPIHDPDNDDSVDLGIQQQPPAATPSLENQTNILEVHGQDDHEHEHTPAEHVRDTDPWRIHIYIANHPCKSCWFFFSWFILCGIILVSVPEILAFSTDVPFYIRNNQPTQDMDALTAGKEDASWERQTNADTVLQQESDAGVTLKLLYKAKGNDNLVQEKYLRLMDEIENKVKAASGYDEVCSRVYSGREINDDTPYKCSRQTTITSFFDESYFLPSTNDNYTIYPTLNNFVQFLAPSMVIDGSVDLNNKDYSAVFVNEILAYWAGYDKGHGPPLDYVRKYYNGIAMPAKFSYQRLLDGELTNFSMANIFASLVDKNFAYDTPLDTNVDVAMSIFSFGLPLAGYSNSDDDTDEQQSEIGEWCYDELHELFIEFKEGHEDDMEFYWACADMADHYSQSVLLSDGMFMIATFLSVYIMMIANTGSVFLASMGMIMVFLNFLPAILLYRYIAQLQYFGTLCIMAMFIILSIGADDIFVIVDTWSQYRTAAPDEPMEKRLTATLKHAGKVMATTSLSTIFSFIGNTTSLFPAVYTFGAFAAIIVFVNYCAVVLFFPTVLAVHEIYFYTPNLKHGCFQTRKCGANNKRCCCFDNEKPVLESELDEKDRKRPIDKWFEYRLFPWIQGNRKNLLAVTFIFLIVFFYSASQLEPDSDAPQFYPNGNNYQEFGGVLSDNFASENAYQLTTQIVWGIDGIDRDGTDPTIREDIGNVIYSDERVSFHKPAEQQYIAQFCDDLLCQYSPYSCRYSESVYDKLKISDPENYGSERINVVKCFMTEFREWVLTDSKAQPNTSDIEEILIEYNITDENITAEIFDDCEFGVFPVEGDHCFGLLFSILWLNDDLPTSNPDYAAGIDNYDYWKEYLWVKEMDETSLIGPFVSTLQLKFFIVSVLTEAEITDDFNDGMIYFDDWQDYISRWRNNKDGSSSVDKNGLSFNDTPSSLTSIMATANGFPYFFIQEQILNEAYIGIAISLVLAFIILTLATQNWIMSLYSVFVIGSIVVCVMGFTTMMGWKLGIIEAVIYVMVVGMSVDYVVHLSEAYLASGKHFRQDRARRMLGIVGGSVVSGAISTLIGILWLFFATVQIFFKFGSFIFFLIAVSLTFSLISFTAAMISFGPEGSSGNVVLCAKRIWRCLKKQDDEHDNVTHIEMN